MIEENEKIFIQFEPQVRELLADCTDYQRAWFAHYVGDAAFNASEAARLAGSKASEARNSGYATKNLPVMTAAVTEHLRCRGISKARIIERLAQVAFADAGNSLDASGRFSAASMRRHGLSGLVRRISYHSQNVGGGVRSVEFESPLTALTLLGRATEGGMFRDNARVEHLGEMAVEHREVFDYYQLSDEDLTELERLHVKATASAQLDAPSGSS